MSRILVLAPSGFGKTFSMGKVPELGHDGLNPQETFLISVVNKDLNFPNWNKDYVLTTPDRLKDGNRIICNNPEVIADVIRKLSKSPFKTVVLDDINYLMQDYYMANALKGGWDTPKKIGYFMSLVFDAIDLFEGEDRHFVILAHSELGEDLPGGRKKMKMKTTGKMVDEYITPEGKVDITLIGRTIWDTNNKTIKKEYITNEEEFISGAKSWYGMMELYIPNDLGYVIKKINEYKNSN